MNDLASFNLAFVRALPESVSDQFAQILSVKVKGEKRLARLADTPPIALMALGQGRFTVEELQRLVEATGAEPKGSSDVDLAEAIVARRLWITVEESLGARFPEFQALVAEIEAAMPPIALLKPDPSEEGQSPVAFFNTEAEDGEEWILVDLSGHPTPEVRRDSRILVKVDDEGEAAVSLSDDQLRLPAEGWVALYAHPHTELPSANSGHPSHKELLAKIPPEFLKAYERVASATRRMETINLLSLQAARPYWGIYAQLGGLLHEWPDQSLGEQEGRRVVVRTYANSEPWVEVTLDESQNFHAASHIS